MLIWSALDLQSSSGEQWGSSTQEGTECGVWSQVPGRDESSDCLASLGRITPWIVTKERLLRRKSSGFLESPANNTKEKGAGQKS